MPNATGMPRLTFGLTLPPDLPPGLLFGLANLAEALGFERLWFPDHLLNVGDDSPAADAWTAIAAVAARTKRITLGTAVSDPHRHHPAVLAQRVATLDQLSRGRVILGLGSGEAMNLDPFGIPWNKPFTRLRESMAAIRHLLDSREPLTCEGEFYRFRNAVLSVRPWRDRRIPIYLAALGPKTLEFAGRHADGWFPVVIPPAHYASYAEPMLTAAAQAGRSPDGIDRVVMLPLVLTTDEEKVRRRAREYAMSLVWPPVVRQMGLGHLLPEGLETDYMRVNPCDPESLRQYRENQQRVPDELLREFLCWGDVRAVSDRIQAYVDAGATHIDVMNASPDPLTSTVALAAGVMPRFTGRPPTLPARLLQAVLPHVERTGLLRKLRKRLPSARRLDD